MTSRSVLALAATGLAMALVSSADAAITLGNGDAVSLSTVLNSNDRQVIVGDKLFTFLAYTSSQFSANTTFISGFIANNPLDGIGFDITGGFGDAIPGDLNISEFNIRYTVEVLPAFVAQGYRIKDVALLFNGAATGSGSYARVDETVLDALAPTAPLLTQLSAFAIAGQASVFQDFEDFSPANYLKLDVNKDVKFFANGTGGTASASFVRQSFSQVVPAPASGALLGLAGLVAIRRRR